ncbi:ATP-binding protein [Haloarchaeobius sp. TZWWS8]|uniref:response regulator n=1 Tax=Haloarchaeobius sp. TZWWS8 TaxID=3446121 RepID=UPI003EBDB3DD
MAAAERGSSLTDRFQRGTIHVLYVDSDETLTSELVDYLQAECPDTVIDSATGIDDALTYLDSSERVDCVVSDYRLTDGTAVELLAEVRSRSATLPFVLFTRREAEDVVTRVLAAGLSEYVHKQAGRIQFLILANRIRNLVTQYRAMLELAPDRTETQFRLLVETIEDYAIFLLDQQGVIKTWNRGATKIKGYTAAEAVGEHFSLFYRDEDIEAGIPQRNLAEAAENGRLATGGWRVRKDGSEFWADVVLTALETDGELVGFAKITRDMTNQVREQELIKQNEFLQQFAGTVSHDLLNPLTTAQANLHAGMETGDTERFEAADAALSRMRKLIDDLLDLAKKGERIRDPEPTELRTVATRAWKSASGGRGTLECWCDIVLAADEPRLEQLFGNLFSNALVHCGDDVTVRIGTTEGGFFVEDDGPGISEETKKHVFETRFTTREDGTGFGLAIVNQIATAHGWLVAVTDAEGDGGGARFEFTNVNVF